MTPIPTEKPRAVRLRADILQTAVFQTVIVNRQCLVVIEMLHKVAAFSILNTCTAAGMISQVVPDLQGVCAYTFHNDPEAAIHQNNHVTAPHLHPSTRLIDSP